jgi:ribosomal protein S18 acetylase RimI-like enzyme
MAATGEVFLTNINISAEWQGQGLGTAVLRSVITAAAR